MIWECMDIGIGTCLVNSINCIWVAVAGAYVPEGKESAEN